ncbi:DoxX family protein [Pullulanibacillus sp. KACC 23026]|uniref:DoxX family membrane protein n=1 Tax=Pullulanibacillus sp. KACC 23026 TaxID=3028315 RepID=UPI0023AFCAA1|nr:DoxX family protein [Pullulanibacillus sp. KACC 23026]WEG11031.1 DoxX family protein [Pullulanibacillus sp. KACC 23026]
MIVKFLRENKIASYLLLVLRFYIGYEWMKAGLEKLTGQFEANGFLIGAIKKATGENPAVQHWWASFLNGVALPNAGIFNFLIPWGEFLVGLGLILGGLTTFAALMGAVMNFAYMLSGTTSTNPQMVLLTMFILVAGANAGKLGLDYYLRQILTYEKLAHKFHTNNHHHPHLGGHV